MSAPIIKAGAAAACLGVAITVGQYAVTGPVQALVLIARPQFSNNLEKRSCRTDVIQDIQRAATFRGHGQYVVVMGDKGCGKTTAIKTAFEKRPGLVHVRIAAGTSFDDIIEKVMRRVAGSKNRSVHADRVLFWYRVLTGGRWPVTIVLEAAERRAGEDFASLPGSVREMADRGIVVVVDASPNSIPPELLTTIRERVVEVGSMTDAQFGREFQDLVSDAKLCGCEQLVRAIIGNVPATAVKLQDALAGCSPAEKASKLEAFIKSEVTKAIQLVKTRTKGNPALANILKEFQHSAKVVPENIELESPGPDKLLRQVLLVEEYLVVPASAPAHFVLFHGLNKCPSFSDLNKLAEKNLPEWQ